MTEPLRIERLSRLLSPAAAASSIAVALLVLAGWSYDIPRLRAPILGQVSVKMDTSVGFLLAGLALLIRLRPRSLWRHTARYALEVPLLVVAIGGLSQYVSSVDLSVDQALQVLIAGEPTATIPGVMAPTTALGLLLLAGALIADHRIDGIGRGTSRSFATLLLLLALTSMLGYAYGAPVLYLGIEGVNAMALTTAVVLIALAIGIIWLHPSYGFPAMLIERTVVGTQIRALLPIVIGAPLLAGAAVSAGYGDLYEGPFAIALTSLGSVLAAGLVAIASIVVLRRADNALYVRDRALAATTNGVVITDHRSINEPVVFVNTAFSQITGYTRDDMLGNNCRILNSGCENEEETMAALRDTIANGCDGTFELRNKRKDGKIFWNRLSIAPVENYEGNITHFVGIMDDVSQKKEREERLNQALKEARNANRSRDTFIRLASHELRTPLNAALTWTRLMEVDDSEDTIRKGVSIVAQSIESQSRLLDDLVDVTRFQSQGVRLEAEDVNICDLVELSAEELRPTVEPDLSLVLHIEPGNYAAKADPLRVQQIVRNLISNAGKYTAAGGTIRVSLRRLDASVQLSVEDTGKGLTDDQLKRVFEPFWRADDRYPGLGVGLFIVTALVAAHGGHIEAHSDGLGKGSRFSVWLPTDAAPNQLAALHDESVEETVDDGSIDKSN